MKNMYWMDEVHSTEVDFKISFAKRWDVGCYRTHEVFLVYFVGIRIWATWLFLNFVQLLKIVLNFEWKGFIPIEHIYSFGISVEFTNQFKRCVVYAECWEMGKFSKDAVTEWEQIWGKEEGIHGYLKFDAEVLEVIFLTGKAICEINDTYRFFKIKKSQPLNVDLKIF